MTILIQRASGPWPGTPTAEPKVPTFTAGWPDTLDQLRLEVVALHGDSAGYPDATVILWYPGVIVETAGLRLTCDTYADGCWRCPAIVANLRAIVLTLEAMRAVRRHGVELTHVPVPLALAP